MKLFTDDRPIVACSTGNLSNTAIAIVRLSGFSDLNSLQVFFEFNFTKIKPRFCHLTNLIFENKTLDNILICFFPEKNSFTGENTLELHVHGNKLNVDRILQLFVEQAGFRLAHPGEFSYRAYKNKKLSLSQIEGLDLFLNANSTLMLEQGLDVLQGQLHESYLKLYDLFLRLKSSVELLIDFSEDVGEDYAKEMYFKHLEDLKRLVGMLHFRTQGQFSALLNPEIVIVGETNAGKSSFFNKLLNHDRSIVSNIKGTTRDYISEVISHRGNNYILVDTAGIRETFDEIERIGISRSYEKIKHGFYKILIINPYELDINSLKNLSQVFFDLIVFSHADLPDFHSRIANFDLSFLKTKSIIFTDLNSGSIGPKLASGPIGPDSISGSIGPRISSGPIGPDSKSGSIGPKIISGPIGPDNKSGSIGPVVLELIDRKYCEISANKPILLERHRHKINELNDFLISNSNEFESLDDLAIVSSEINRLGSNLSELIGQVSADDVLNSVFSNFCIGK